MTLQERLDARRLQFERTAPKEKLDVIQRAMRDLRRSGTLERVLKVGEQAPDFALPNSTGQLVRLANLQAQGPLVLSFYRGNW